MDTFQKIWLVILAPLFFVYGVNELIRGWKILKHGEYSPNLAIQIRVWLLRLFRGDQESNQYKRHLQSTAPIVQKAGIYSILGGLVTLIVSVAWIWLLYKSLI